MNTCWGNPLVKTVGYMLSTLKDDQ